MRHDACSVDRRNRIVNFDLTQARYKLFAGRGLHHHGRRRKAAKGRKRPMPQRPHDEPAAVVLFDLLRLIGVLDIQLGYRHWIALSA